MITIYFVLPVMLCDSGEGSIPCQKSLVNLKELRLLQESAMVPMLEAHMQLLSRMTALPRPNERILTLLLQYMQYSITHGPAFKVIRSHVKPMLFNAALPLMYFSADDKELFVTDPHEFVRKVWTPQCTLQY